jgi:hypothetical protein
MIHGFSGSASRKDLRRKPESLENANSGGREIAPATEVADAFRSIRGGVRTIVPHFFARIGAASNLTWTRG